MVPLLVEYSKDEDAGCAVGTALIVGMVAATLLLIRLAARGRS